MESGRIRRGESTLLILLIVLCLVGIYQMTVRHIQLGGIIALSGVVTTLLPVCVSLLKADVDNFCQ